MRCGERQRSFFAEIPAENAGTTIGVSSMNEKAEDEYYSRKEVSKPLTLAERRRRLAVA